MKCSLEFVDHAIHLNICVFESGGRETDEWHLLSCPIALAFLFVPDICFQFMSYSWPCSVPRILNFFLLSTSFQFLLVPNTGFSTGGIYRVSGKKDLVDKLQEDFPKGRRFFLLIEAAIFSLQ